MALILIGTLNGVVFLPVVLSLAGPGAAVSYFLGYNYYLLRETCHERDITCLRHRPRNAGGIGK